jgi:hypothetical protein
MATIWWNNRAAFKGAKIYYLLSEMEVTFLLDSVYCSFGQAICGKITN